MAKIKCFCGGEVEIEICTACHFNTSCQSLRNYKRDNIKTYRDLEIRDRFMPIDKSILPEDVIILEMLKIWPSNNIFSFNYALGFYISKDGLLEWKKIDVPLDTEVEPL